MSCLKGCAFRRAVNLKLETAFVIRSQSLATHVTAGRSSACHADYVALRLSLFAVGQK
jgi:hypothetical protein